MYIKKIGNITEKCLGKFFPKSHCIPDEVYIIRNTVFYTRKGTSINNKTYIIPFRVHSRIILLTLHPIGYIVTVWKKTMPSQNLLKKAGKKPV